MRKTKEASRVKLHPSIQPVESSPLSPQPVILEMISYNEKTFEKYDSIPIDELLGRIQSDSVNWINVDGLSDNVIIQKIGKRFNLHHLMMEDIRTTEHRPKMDEYQDHIFFTMKMLYQIKEHEIDYEHISFVLGNHFLLSFQEKEGDIFGNLRDRIRMDTGIIRKRGADYLLYRLVDTIVDSYYAILENIGYKLEVIEEHISGSPTIDDFRQIQELKKDFIYLRKVVFPLREALNKLMKNETGFIEERNIKYFSDVYDHVIQLLDSLDTYKDLTSTLMDLYMNTINYKMNEVMKLLTVITTIFIPLSFVAGIYGMNFENMPELTWEYGYFEILGVMTLIFIGMLYYFKHKKWF